MDGFTTWYHVPTSGSYPFEFAAGPDGNMWLTKETSGKIGRVTPAGAITEFWVVAPSPGTSLIDRMTAISTLSILAAVALRQSARRPPAHSRA